MKRSKLLSAKQMDKIEKQIASEKGGRWKHESRLSRTLNKTTRKFEFERTVDMHWTDGGDIFYRLLELEASPT